MRSTILGAFALSSATLSSALGPVAAAYFQTNALGGRNYIVASGINAQGELDSNFASTTSTGGVGAQGINNASTPLEPHADPFYTQDSVRVAGSYLFAVNAGSNTVSMFNIDVANPTKLTLVSTVASGGDFPSSIGVNDAKTMACVVNSGMDNCVACFTIDPEAGLIPIPDSKRSLGITQTNPPMGPENTASDLVFDNSGNVLVSVKGFNATAPGYLGRLKVMDGMIAPDIEKFVPNGGALPFSITTPKSLGDGNIIFTTDPGVGVVTYDLTSSPVKNNGTIIPGQKAVAVDASTFVTSIVKQYDFDLSAGLTDVAISAGTKSQYLHILAAGEQKIITMELVSSGNGKIIQTLDIAAIVKKNSGMTLTASMSGLAIFVVPQSLVTGTVASVGAAARTVVSL
ncbi:hypothetical protein RQP46_002833 [Phenoliferia psychrophenolica]